MNAAGFDSSLPRALSHAGKHSQCVSVGPLVLAGAIPQWQW